MFSDSFLGDIAGDALSKATPQKVKDYLRRNTVTAISAPWFVHLHLTVMLLYLNNTFLRVPNWLSASLTENWFPELAAFAFGVKLEGDQTDRYQSDL